MNAKIIALLVICVGVSGCGAWERTVAHYTGWSRICVEGVSYLQFPSGVTVEYTTDGRIKNCK